MFLYKLIPTLFSSLPYSLTRDCWVLLSCSDYKARGPFTHSLRYWFYCVQMLQKFNDFCCWCCKEISYVSKNEDSNSMLHGTSWICCGGNFLVDFTMDLLQRCQGCELLSFNVAKGKSRIFLYLFWFDFRKINGRNKNFEKYTSGAIPHGGRFLPPCPAALSPCRQGARRQDSTSGGKAAQHGARTLPPNATAAGPYGRATWR
jgi:hypothetical protein